MKKMAWMGLAALALALGGCDDGGTEDVDAGGEPGVDSGSPGTDAGGGDTDGGPTPGDDGGAGDAGMPDGDGGADTDAGPPVLSCSMGTIRIQETCPAFTACGGELVGSWCYADICMTKHELLAQALMQPGVPSGCTEDEIEVRSSTGSVDGTVDVTATTITRMVTSTATGTFYLSDACKVGTCGGTQAALNFALGSNGTASCTREDPGCLCDVTFNSEVNTTDGYSITGDTITLDGSGRTFDYCVESSGDLRFHETTEGGEPGTQTALPLPAP